MEKGESKADALVRECKEELDIIVEPQDIYMELVHEYPDITVRLTLFNSVIKSGVPKLLEHNDIKWITASEIGQYDFCPADEEILRKIIGVRR